MKKGLTIVLATLSIILIGCSSTEKIIETKTAQIGDKVEIKYSATFEDNSVFQAEELKEITIGNDEIIKGLTDGIIGMKIGEEKEILLTPENAYGNEYDSSKIQQISKFIFDRLSLVPEIGKEYEIGDIKGIAIGIEGDGDYTQITLDANPLHTYKNIIYKLRLERFIE